MRQALSRCQECGTVVPADSIKLSHQGQKMSQDQDWYQDESRYRSRLNIGPGCCYKSLSCSYPWSLTRVVPGPGLTIILVPALELVLVPSYFCSRHWSWSKFMVPSHNDQGGSDCIVVYTLVNEQVTQ